MHYIKVAMHMLLGYRINNVQYNAGFLYKYLKLYMIIHILFQCKILALANFLIVTLAKCQYWSVCIKFSLFTVGSYITKILINDMYHYVNLCELHIL